MGGELILVGDIFLGLIECEFEQSDDDLLFFILLFLATPDAACFSGDCDLDLFGPFVGLIDLEQDAIEYELLLLLIKKFFRL